MIKVLIVGMNPHTIDFSQPGFMPGLTTKKVEVAIEAERESLKLAGYETEIHFIDTGGQDLSGLIQQLGAHHFDGIMIGAGVRVPPSNFLLFEKLINTFREHAPCPKIIFNTNPQDTATAIRRWL